MRVRCGDRYRVVRWECDVTVVEGQVERIRGSIRSIGPCEHDRFLARPWMFEEASELPPQ